MARNPKLLAKRNAAIVARYEQLRGQRIAGRRKYTAAYCIAKLAEEYHLSERTLEDIVWKARP